MSVVPSSMPDQPVHTENVGIAVPPARWTNIRSSSSWLLAGNASYAAARWLVLALLAKFGSQAMVGQYVWALAVCMPAIMFCRFGGRILITTDAKDELRIGEYLGFTLVSMLLGMAVVLGILFIWPPMKFLTLPPLPGLPDWLTLHRGVQVVNTHLIYLVLIVAVWNSIESISEIFTGLFQRYDRFDYMAMSFIVQAVAMCVLTAVAVIATDSVLIAAAGLAISGALRLLAFEVPLARRLVSGHRPLSIRTVEEGDVDSLAPRLSARALSHILRHGVPLAIVTFLMAYTVAVPRYVLRDTLGDARLGVFGALYALATASNLLVSSIAQSLSSHLAVLYAGQDYSRFLRLMFRAIGLSVVISGCGLVIAIVGGKLLLSLAYSSAYAADNEVFVILMVFGMTEGISAVVGTATSSMRQFRVQVPIHLLKLAITYVGLLLVVPSSGLVGAAWVLVASSIFANLCYAGICWWQLRDGGKP